MAELVINYTGNSMFPTLKMGDSLRVLPYRNTGIRVGDVVVFRSPYDRPLIVHRVVCVGNKGVRTKGDNCRLKDNMVLQQNEIVGKVIAVRRGKKRITICGGFQGRMYAWALGVRKRIDLVFSTILRPAYRWFAQSGIFNNLFSCWMHTRISYYKHREGTELQLLWNRRMIGRLIPGQKRWHIRRPFRLFLNESALPRSEDVEGKQTGHGVEGENS